MYVRFDNIARVEKDVLYIHDNIGVNSNYLIGHLLN